MLSTYQTILVSRDIDGDNLLKTEVPLEIRLDERYNKSTRGGVDVDRAVDTLGYEQIVDLLGVFVFAGVGSSSSKKVSTALLAYEDTHKMVQMPIVFSSTRETASSGSIT